MILRKKISLKPMKLLKLKDKDEQNINFKKATKLRPIKFTRK